MLTPSVVVRTPILRGAGYSVWVEALPIGALAAETAMGVAARVLTTTVVLLTLINISAAESI